MAAPRAHVGPPSCPLCNRPIDRSPEHIQPNLELARLQREHLFARQLPAASAPTLAPPPEDAVIRYSLDASEIVVGDVIGSGRFAAVHRGTWHGAPVALKIPHARFKEGSLEVRHFLREVRLLATLRHPNIASLFGVARGGDGRLILVMKLGLASLWDAMRGGAGLTAPSPLPLGDALRVAVGVARALVYLHKRTPPVVHCDIKSANIVLDDHGKPMLTDFGVSRELSTAAAATTAGAAGARGTSGAPRRTLTWSTSTTASRPATCTRWACC